jgi:hypothetical protein
MDDDEESSSVTGRGAFGPDHSVLPPPYGLYRHTSAGSGSSGMYQSASGVMQGAVSSRSSGPLPINKDLASDTGWYPFLEDMLAASAEEAQGYRAMHEKAHKHYSKISSRLMIPAIILSTLTGVANFGQPSLEEIVGSRAPLYIGVVSIIAAIFSTIAKYLRADEKSELHRTAMISWDKLHRLLSTVLAQPRRNRIDAQEFLMQYREERNRLTEQVPVIPYKIRTWFIDTYGRLYKHAQIQKPSILVLSDVTVYRSETARPDPDAGSPLTIPNASVMPQVPRADREGRLAYVRGRFQAMFDAMRGRREGPVTLASSSPRSLGTASDGGASSEDRRFVKSQPPGRLDTSGLSATDATVDRVRRIVQQQETLRGALEEKAQQGPTGKGDPPSATRQASAFPFAFVGQGATAEIRRAGEVAGTPHATPQGFETPRRRRVTPPPLDLRQLQRAAGASEMAAGASEMAAGASEMPAGPSEMPATEKTERALVAGAEAGEAAAAAGASEMPGEDRPALELTLSYGP